MKIYISADIEGICGVASWDETEADSHGYTEACVLMTNEVKTCCEALISEGITDITVRDAHDSALNIDINQLPKEVKLIRNWSGGLCEMMDGLDASFDAAILIGYHSPSRSDGNPLSHTLNTRHNHIKINSKVVSEYLLNTYYAQTFGVPVIMVTGDENLCTIVKNENSLTQTVSTKTGLHGALISKNPKMVLEEIEKATKHAVKVLNNSEQKDLFIFVPRVLDTEIHYRKHEQAYFASFYPGAKALSSDKTIFNTTDVKEMLKFIMFCDR